MNRRNNELNFVTGNGGNKNIEAKNYRRPKLTTKFGKSNAQFPGEEVFPNKSIEQIREVIINQKKIKGFVFDVPAGASDFPIQISGEARVMLGFSLLALSNVDDPALQPESFSMLFNEEIVVRDVHPAFLSPFFTDEEYYQLPRPMSGQDAVSVQFENAGLAQQVAMVVYYL